MTIIDKLAEPDIMRRARLRAEEAEKECRFGDAEDFRICVEEIGRLRTFLETVQVISAGAGLYIGVIAKNGCWSAPIPEQGREIFLQWKTDRNAALDNT